MLAEKPAYGLIAWVGNVWSVTYVPERDERGRITATGHLQGYGEFPYERFPGIPVIDLTDNDVAFQKCLGPDKPASYEYGDSDLETYIQWHIDRGVRVIANGWEGMK